MFGILAFGDSITFGRGNNLDRGWVGRLRVYLETKDEYNAVYNQGIPGDTSKGLLKRIDIECSARMKYNWPGDRYVTLIAIGTNDSKLIGKKECIPIEDFKRNLKKIVKIAKKHTKKVVLVGLTPVDERFTNDYEGTYFFDDRIKEYNTVIDGISKNEKILFIDLYSKMIKTNYKKLLDDGLHPNAEGYELMYKIIKKELIKNKLIN